MKEHTKESQTEINPEKTLQALKDGNKSIETDNKKTQD